MRYTTLASASMPLVSTSAGGAVAMIRSLRDCREDILIEPEQIVGIVSRFELSESGIRRRRIRLGDAVTTFVAELVDVDAVRVRRDAIPEPIRPCDVARGFARIV